MNGGNLHIASATAGGVGGLLHAVLMDSANAPCLPCYDGNGNIAAWVHGGNGSLIERREYDSFGNMITVFRLAADAALHAKLFYGFSTKWRDPESELLYYGHRYYNPNTQRWFNRDPIEEEGGLNLYGFVGNDGVNRWDFLGMVGDRKKMLDLIHNESIVYHKAAEVEYIKQIKVSLYTTHPNINRGEKYKIRRPKEYGGRVCEKCNVSEIGEKTYTYRLTMTSGVYPDKGGASVYPNGAKNCESYENFVGYWHTHPSWLSKNEMKQEFGQRNKKPRIRYYWGAGESFSGTPTDGKGDYGYQKNKHHNPDGLPNYVTYRNGTAIQPWTYKTDEITPKKTVRESSPQPTELIELPLFPNNEEP